MSLMKVHRCYDSHLHWLATGQVQEEINLAGLRDFSQIKNWVHHLSQRGEWLVGFGWDQHQWSKHQKPTCEVLDQYFSDRPVCWSRADGHAFWFNSEALRRVQSELEKFPAQEMILKDEYGKPSGVVLDGAMAIFESVMPSYSSEQKLRFLKVGQKILNTEGFTHIRDMSGDEEQWNLMCQLQDQRQLSLYVEQNFYCESMYHLEKTIQLAERARDEKRSHLRATGIKFYMDGALGSSGAFLSVDYPDMDLVKSETSGGASTNSSASGTKGHRGLTLYSEEELVQGIFAAWRAGFEAAVHAIGDAAAERVVSAALKAQALCEQKGFSSGILNVEHGEVMRRETIAQLRLLKARVHMQPCHWLTDRQWLQKKLGALYADAFPWRELEKNNIAIQFGSDTPIEKCSFENNLRALRESPEFGIAAFQGSVVETHAHPDSSWGAKCWTEFDSLKPKSVYFDGERLG